jgi:glycerol-3-phosphate cytidylyltransferase
MSTYSGEDLTPCTLTYGTFDVLHFGHIRLLIKASALGLPIRIGLSTDNFNSVKNKAATLSYEERAEILMKIKNVDMVFPEESWEQKQDDIIKYNAKYLIMGGDWENKFNHLSSYVEIRYFERTPYISSSEIRQITG